jgi:scyllo-inositol 2-dehydrogenase (NADP+)
MPHQKRSHLHIPESMLTTLEPQTINVGLVGFGFAGQVFHAPVIHATEGVRLAAIVSSKVERDPRYPEVVFVRNVEQMLAIERIRLVVVATPNSSHFEIARQCILAGRDVVVDKPFATTLKEARSLVQLAAELGRTVTVYQNRRWDGDFKTVQNLLEQSVLGRVASFESYFDRFRPALKQNAWRERAEVGAGVLFDLGPHLIDQALVLFGIPDAITADVRIEREVARVDDAFDIVFHYKNMRAVLGASMLAASPRPTYHVLGTGGSFIKHGMAPQEEALKQGRSPREPNWGTERAEMWGKIVTRERSEPVPTLAGDYRGFYENVRDALRGRAELAITPQQAVNVMQAIMLSFESSKRRCTLNWDALQ